MPRLDTFKKHNYSAVLYSYTEFTQGGTVVDPNTKFYTEDGPIDIGVVANLFGRISVSFKLEDVDRLQQSSRLAVLLDPSGRELYPGGIWTMQGLLPIINLLGSIEGYHGEAKLTDITTPGRF